MKSFSLGAVILAGLGFGIAATLVEALIIGKMFHAYQRYTPATFRATEGNRQYAASAFIRLLGGFLFACVFVAIDRDPTAARGAMFGAASWFAFQAPSTINDSLYINLHLGFTMGRLVSGALTGIIAGAVCGWILSLL